MFTSPLISRLAALLLLAATMLAVYTYLIEPMAIGYTETSRRIEEMRDQLSRLERAAATWPVLAKQLDDFQAQQRSRGYFLSGTTDALAAASLQDRVHDLVMVSGGTLESVEPMPGIEEQGLMRVTLRVQMAGANGALFDVLYALESGNPILFVDNLSIQNRGGAGGENDAGGGDNDLTVAFDLSGYLPKGEQ